MRHFESAIPIRKQHACSILPVAEPKVLKKRVPNVTEQARIGRIICQCSARDHPYQGSCGSGAPVELRNFLNP
jgi:hypothetical protein